MEPATATIHPSIESIPVSSPCLTREIRVVLDPIGLRDANLVWKQNSWGFQPAGLSLFPTLAIRLTVSGPIDPLAGYVCDIRDLECLFRHTMESWYRKGHPPTGILAWSQQLFTELHRQPWPIDPTIRFQMLEVLPNPQLQVRLRAESPTMLTLTREYEFSAAHRLHVPQWSEEDNLARFGKCNRPHGHGHNYVLAVTVELPTGESPVGGTTPLNDMDMSVKARVIDRLDHTHLNLDVAEFATLNPTVENIAGVVWRWLDGAFHPGRLARIRLYETPKTWVELSAS